MNRSHVWTKALLYAAPSVRGKTWRHHTKRPTPRLLWFVSTASAPSRVDRCEKSRNVLVFSAKRKQEEREWNKKEPRFIVFFFELFHHYKVDCQWIFIIIKSKLCNFSLLHGLTSNHGHDTYICFIGRNLDSLTTYENNMLSSHVKILPLLWLHNKSSLSHQKNYLSEMVWYFIGVYIIKRTLHGRLEILRSLVKYFSTLEEKFRISARPCNILYIIHESLLHFMSFPDSYSVYWLIHGSHETASRPRPVWFSCRRKSNPVHRISWT